MFESFYHISIKYLTHAFSLQVARQYYQNERGMFLPCEDYPNCPHCPMILSDTPACGSDGAGAGLQCNRCGAIRMTLYDISTEQLEVGNLLAST